MRAVGKSVAADDAERLARPHLTAAFGDGGGEASEVRVESVEAVMADEDFQPARAAAIHGDHAPVGDGVNRPARWRAQVDPVMECASERTAGQDARTERRGDAGVVDGGRQGGGEQQSDGGQSIAGAMARWIAVLSASIPSLSSASFQAARQAASALASTPVSSAIVAAVSMSLAIKASRKPAS